MPSSTDDQDPQRSNHEGSPSRDEDEDTLRAAAERLGLTQLVFRDESSAPDVDHELLSALACRDLAEPVARLVYRLVFSFESWHDAFTQAVIQYDRQRRAQPPEHNSNPAKSR